MFFYFKVINHRFLSNFYSSIYDIVMFKSDWFTCAVASEQHITWLSLDQSWFLMDRLCNWVDTWVFLMACHQPLWFDLEAGFILVQNREVFLVQVVPQIKTRNVNSSIALFDSLLWVHVHSWVSFSQNHLGFLVCLMVECILFVITLGLPLWSTKVFGDVVKLNEVLCDKVLSI